jgi:uncharacterized membrane protein YbhN (UPF0104 family)
MALNLRDWKSYFRGEGEPGWHFLTVLLTIGAVLSGAALFAVASVAGWSNVLRTATHARWGYIVAAPMCVLVSHLGYALAYREVARVERGPDLGPDEVVAIVATGFGLVSPRGGFALDERELSKRGLTRREAQLRVRTLGTLEYAVLAPATFAAALYMFVDKMQAQSGLLPSWIIGFPLGAVVVLAALLVHRRKGARRGQSTSDPPRSSSWPRPVRRWLDAIEGMLKLLRSWPAGALAMAGMALYWACEIAALGTCMEAFAHKRGAVAVLLVGYATGYALTRRSLPLGGAGVVEVLLPFALSSVGFPLAAAILGVVAYRIFNLWVALIPATLGWRRLRNVAVRQAVS